MVEMVVAWWCVSLTTCHYMPLRATTCHYVSLRVTHLFRPPFPFRPHRILHRCWPHNSSLPSPSAPTSTSSSAPFPSQPSPASLFASATTTAAATGHAPHGPRRKAQLGHEARMVPEGGLVGLVGLVGLGWVGGVLRVACCVLRVACCV